VEVAEHSLAVLGIVLFVGLLVPELLVRFHIPFATSLILLGAVLGPHGLEQIQVDDTLTLFAFLGATFQMLLAGIEAGGLDLRPFQRANLFPYLGGGLLPATMGAGLAMAVGLGWAGALLTASVFMSSSILLVFSFADDLGVGKAALGLRLKSATVLWELSSALLAFVVLKLVDPHPRFSLPILVGLVVSFVAFLRLFVPEIVQYVFSRFEAPAKTESERRVRFTLALLLVVLFLFTGLDVPAVVAAFLVGFALASARDTEVIQQKLHLVGYALFIPVFLFVVGLEVDLTILLNPDIRTLAVGAFVVTAIFSKFGGSYLATGSLGFSARDRAVFGLASTAKLTIPITTTYAALKAGIVPPAFLSGTVIVSILTSVMVPIVIGLTSRSTMERPDA
jgi:Kef-type K+ transport system membrane component KefB